MGRGPRTGQPTACDSCFSFKLNMAEEAQAKILLEKETQCNSIPTANSTVSGRCPQFWDRILCWPETEPGQEQILPCPDYFFGFDPKQNATRFCHDNGTWHNWTNYTKCSNSNYITVTEPFKEAVNDSTVTTYLPVVTDIATAGYSISLVSLIFAFAILASIRTLRCPRNILHMHLFVSFIMRALVSLLKDTVFVLSIGLPSNLEQRSGRYYFREDPERNIWECKLLFSIWQYFMLANYSWILMEALYLHNLIFNALFSDRSSVKAYIILGWGLPLLFVIPWVVCRIFLDDNLCWTVNNNHYVFVLIQGPLAVSNIICLILFVNIVRVIFTKLRATLCEETRIYRRLAKSTLVLMPLFGVHYIIYHIMSWCKPEMSVEMVGLFIDRLFTSFQGFCVALLYCFLNAEVRTELNKTRFWWPRRRNTNASDGMVNGMLGSSRFFSASRHRPSCYSSTSCTSLSLGVNTNWAATRRRDRDSGYGHGLSHVGPHGSVHGFLTESPSPCFDRVAVSYHPSEKPFCQSRQALHARTHNTKPAEWPVWNTPAATISWLHSKFYVP